MPSMPISLVSNIDPNDVAKPTGVDTRAHSVATHDSLKQVMYQGRRRKMQSLSGVAACKVCQKWQHVKSVRSGSMESLSEVAAYKVCWEWQHVKSVGSGSMRSLSVEWQHVRSLSLEGQHMRSLLLG